MVFILRNVYHLFSSGWPSLGISIFHIRLYTSVSLNKNQSVCPEKIVRHCQYTMHNIQNIFQNKQEALTLFQKLWFPSVHIIESKRTMNWIQFILIDTLLANVILMSLRYDQIMLHARHKIYQPNHLCFCITQKLPTT